MPKLHMVVCFWRGRHLFPKLSCIANHNYGMASVMLHLPLLFLFLYSQSLGTDWGSFTMAFASACKSWGPHVPVDVVGWLESVGGSA